MWVIRSEIIFQNNDQNSSFNVSFVHSLPPSEKEASCYPREVGMPVTIGMQRGRCRSFTFDMRSRLSEAHSNDLERKGLIIEEQGSGTNKRWEREWLKSQVFLHRACHETVGRPVGFRPGGLVEVLGREGRWNHR